MTRIQIHFQQLGEALQALQTNVSNIAQAERERNERLQQTIIRYAKREGLTETETREALSQAFPERGTL
jgi:alkylhydroperoxidase/carboxymuconolactone decarboxylase family protein YurZ